MTYYILLPPYRLLKLTLFGIIKDDMRDIPSFIALETS